MLFRSHFIYLATLASDPGSPGNVKHAEPSARSELWMLILMEEVESGQVGVWRWVSLSLLMGKNTFGNR